MDFQLVCANLGHSVAELYELASIALTERHTEACHELHTFHAQQCANEHHDGVISPHRVARRLAGF